MSVARKNTLHVQEMIADLNTQGILLWVENGSLCYDGPKHAITPEVLSLLKSYKEDILQLLKRAISSAGKDALSSQQQRLWFIGKLEGTLRAYHISGVYRLAKDLDAIVLEQALAEVVCRHESLRTVFREEKGIPTQAVCNSMPVKVSVIDGGKLSKEARDTLIRDTIRQDFDLEKGPLFRVALLEGTNEVLLVIVLSHLIADGWSAGIFGEELAAVYDDLLSGKKPAFLSKAGQYREFVLHQQHYLGSKEFQRDLSFWRRKLDGAPDLHQLPTDYARPHSQSYEGAQVRTHISEEDTTALDALCREQKVSRFMVLHSCFAVLLARYSGVNDVVIGTPLAQRLDRRFESTIGFFANTLALRTVLDPTLDFLSLLHTAKKELLEAYEHQEIPFEKLIEELAPERSLSYSPICQILFVLQNAPAVSQTGFCEVKFDTRTSMMDIVCTLEEAKQGLEVVITYKTELFAQETIEQFACHYSGLVGKLLKDPTQNPFFVPLLSDKEHDEIVRDWNSTSRPYDLTRPLHVLIDEVINRTPDAQAVVSEEGSLTFRELGDRADEVAAMLRSRGIGIGDVVAVSLERSCSLMVGLLAILKSGASYVPCDPEYPQQRLEFMIADSGARVLLTSPQFRDRFSGCDVDCIELSEHLNFEKSHSTEVALPAPNDTAYIIYTSGSTGIPKGVMNSHAGIVNRLLWMQEEYPLTPEDVVLQKTPSSFDVSVWEFFWPLIIGSRLIMATPGGHRDAAYLIDVIDKHGVTTIHFVPSMLQIFLLEVERRKREGENVCGSLKRIFCSGEALTKDLADRCLAALKAELHNLYGPTEAAIDVTYWQCTSDSVRRDVPIGKPIANMQTYILDNNMTPVPPGVAGELYLGGVGVAKGYLNRPELTAERFLPDPFSCDPKARLYKTGDLASIDRTGVISYLGRADNQIKLRGFRIELGEVENALTSLNGVNEAIVLFHPLRRGGELIGYVVLSRSTNETSSTILQKLEGILPHFMIPADIVELTHLPLLGNGKVDRAALMKGTQTALRKRVERIAEPPEGVLEKAVASLWSELLNIQNISSTDSFFERGGHSLLASVMVSKLSETIGKDVSVRTLFEHPKLRDFAAQLGDVTVVLPNTHDEVEEVLL